MAGLRHKKHGGTKIRDESVKHSDSHNSAKGMSPVSGVHGNKNVLADAKKGGSGGHIAGGVKGKLGRSRGGATGADKNPFSSAAKAE